MIIRQSATLLLRPLRPRRRVCRTTSTTEKDRQESVMWRLQHAAVRRETRLLAADSRSTWSTSCLHCCTRTGSASPAFTVHRPTTSRCPQSVLPRCSDADDRLSRCSDADERLPRCSDADDRLFNCVLHNAEHVLHLSLPERHRTVYPYI